MTWTDSVTTNTVGGGGDSPDSLKRVIQKGINSSKLLFPNAGFAQMNGTQQIGFAP